MSTGYLIIEVYSETEANPISNARIQILGENTDQTVTTDSSGKTQRISLNAQISNIL